jgi:hypothetical protein
VKEGYPARFIIGCDGKYGDPIDLEEPHLFTGKGAILASAPTSGIILDDPKDDYVYFYTSEGKLLAKICVPQEYLTRGIVTSRECYVDEESNLLVVLTKAKLGDDSFRYVSCYYTLSGKLVKKFQSIKDKEPELFFKCFANNRLYFYHPATATIKVHTMDIVFEREFKFISNRYSPVSGEDKVPLVDSVYLDEKANCSWKVVDQSGKISFSLTNDKGGYIKQIVLENVEKAYHICFKYGTVSILH